MNVIEARNKLLRFGIDNPLPDDVKQAIVILDDYIQEAENKKKPKEMIVNYQRNGIRI